MISGVICFIIQASNTRLNQSTCSSTFVKQKIPNLRNKTVVYQEEEMYSIEFN